MRPTDMDDGARGWLINSVAKNYWRVAHWIEFDDLLREGVYIWYRVVDKYEVQERRVRSRPHLMSLFKCAWGRYLNHLSNLRTLARDNEVLAEDAALAHNTSVVINPADEVWDNLGFSYDAGEFMMLVTEAPEIIQPLLRVLFSSEFLPRLMSENRFYTDGTQETLNDKLCDLLGLDSDHQDLVTPLRTYLTR